jgi:hypothetical protein
MPAERRPEMRQWLQLFETVADEAWRLEAGALLYADAAGAGL